MGDTLLKITDYPFAYSLITILLATKGTSIISNDVLIFIGIAGSLGTILTITDPIGRIIKAYAIGVQKVAFNFYKEPNVEKTKTFRFLAKLNPTIKNIPKVTRRWEDVEGAFHTKAIELEKEKIVSSVYFLILISVADGLIGFTDIIEKNLNEGLQQILCDAPCVKYYSEWVLFGTALILAFVIAWNGSYIFPRTRIVATYLLAINSTHVTKNSTDTLFRFIDNGDWKTAKYWKDIVEEEYVNETGLEIDRIEKRKNHLNSLLGKFKQHKDRLESENEKSLTAYMTGDRSLKHYSFIEILQTFPYYRNLIEHAFTSPNTTKFDQIHNVFLFEKKWLDALQTTDAEEKKKIDEIISRLQIRIDTRTSREIIGNDGQWINLELLRSHLEYFVSTDRTELIPNSKKDNSALHQVRIFDRRGHEEIGPDLIAELHMSDANMLKEHLERLANELRQKNSELRSMYSEFDAALKNLKQMIDEMMLEYESVTIPIGGTCQYCRSEEFTAKSIIESDSKKINSLPTILFDEKQKSISF